MDCKFRILSTVLVLGLEIRLYIRHVKHHSWWTAFSNVDDRYQLKNQWFVSDLELLLTDFEEWCGDCTQQMTKFVNKVDVDCY